jgi:[ribosomal protein S5]-alanine N-acetyltransferase
MTVRDHDALIGATGRLWLLRPPDDVLRGRLARDRLEADILVAGERVRIVFPPTWPGEALPLVASWLAMRQSDPRGEPWSGTLVERASRRAIGTVGCKAWPDATGAVEVGYGIEPSRRGRGLATEGLACLLMVLDAQPGVLRVTAETHEHNAASQAVLRKCGFEPSGEATSEEGRMLWWQRPSPPPRPGLTSRPTSGVA